MSVSIKSVLHIQMKESILLSARWLLWGSKIAMVGLLLWAHAAVLAAAGMNGAGCQCPTLPNFGEIKWDAVCEFSF